MSDKNSFRQSFSKKLCQYLAINEMTQLELSKQVSVSAATVSEWCSGKKMPRIEKIDRICTIFGINRSDLIENTSTSQIVPLDVQKLAQEFHDNPSEQIHLKKYRALDAHGKKTVDLILDNEYERCTSTYRKPEPLPFTDSGLRAAHNDNDNPDQYEKMQRDLDWLKDQ